MEDKRAALPASPLGPSTPAAPPSRWANADMESQQERHSYEKCEYVEFKRRVAKMDELRAAKNGARSN